MRSMPAAVTPAKGPIKGTLVNEAATPVRAETIRPAITHKAPKIKNRIAATVMEAGLTFLHLPSLSSEDLVSIKFAVILLFSVKA